ncbi:hypothetical protein [Novosphingobium sp. EMRT-2]|uniref:hypothetical protein n=1 Tax=Novosphingobium sp. EMRT-2 TaxID=2571749 RepID=UPI0010BD7977|nr:hypothetical protein [Novosphingobium sp. EMRT-2]QCI92410.1 hypothetical protein FA702_01755 [Novosphingobium sp. EMRT-2]
MALLALGASAANAHPARRGLPAPVPQQSRPRLVIVEHQGGFVIRCETPRGPQNPDFPRGAIPPFAIPLGASVHIDRAALPHSNQKEHDHGEIR